MHNAMVATRQISVPFHGANLLLVEHEGQPYTPMKPMALGIGLNWSGQFEKVQANEARWGVRNIRIPAAEGVLDSRMPSSGGSQEMMCLPLRKLPGWLMTLEPNKIKRLDVRARVVQYQNECDDVLWKYWTDGLAQNPRIERQKDLHSTQALASAEALNAAASVANQYFADFRESSRLGALPPSMGQVPGDVLAGIVAHQLIRTRFLARFDPDTMKFVVKALGEKDCVVDPGDRKALFTLLREEMPSSMVGEALRILAGRLDVTVGTAAKGVH